MKKKGKKSAISTARAFLRTFNKYIMVFAGIILIYFLLLFLLIKAESGAEGATITNLGSAIWYSLATFTTVGYGDFYPVTPAGRIVASIFLVLGIGLLGFFVGFMVEFLTRIKPIITLSMNTVKPWYIFTDKSPNAMTFADNLKAVRPDALIIYAETKDDKSSGNYVSTSWSVTELLDKRGSLYDAHIMCMKENEMENFLDAIALSETTVPVICIANFTPAHHPMNINFFSLTSCTARMFWQQYPVTKKDEVILLVGFGNAGTVLLDRALELNVLFKDQNVTYHVFGESEEYKRNRKLLSDFISVNCPAEKGDSIIFHDDLWNTDEQLLRDADRIVLCNDSEQENIYILHTIQTFFSISGSLYIYNSNVRSVATPFGKSRDMLTPAFVLHNRLTDMALCRHELFRFHFGGDIPMWEDLNSLIKDLNYITTDHISLKVHMMLGDEAPCKPFDELEPEILRKAHEKYISLSQEDKDDMWRLEHERNLRFYKLHNFRLGDAVDDESRINPLLKPYDLLSDKEKEIMDTGWALLVELAAHKEARRKH